ncbi:HD domain-containing protein [Deinococcus ruber]|uniref:HD domain-containing protein n=1 Tax=Deinococcus ruber TaxID=1848197 RepID=UPI00166D9609
MSLVIPGSLHSLVLQVEPHHAAKVATLAREAAPRLGLDPALAWAAGFLHDLGKLSLPVQVLEAARPLAGPNGRWCRAIRWRGR